MKILVVSDTHKNFSALFEVVEKNITSIDMLVFLGDGLEDLQVLRHVYPQLEVHAVRGNCDYLPGEWQKIIPLENFNILALHGHQHGVKYGMETLKAYALGCGCSIAFYGHTHMASVFWDDEIFILNPGTVNKKVERGTSATYAVVDICGHKIDYEILKVDV